MNELGGTRRRFEVGSVRWFDGLMDPSVYCSMLLSVAVVFSPTWFSGTKPIKHKTRTEGGQTILVHK